MDNYTSGLGHFGVLEISSNSIHFSVFTPEDRITPCIDKKKKCALGNFAPGSRKLNPEGVEKALKAIAHYKEKYGFYFEDFIAVGTGALRDAKDTKVFVEQLKKDFDIDLEVIDGETEAYYSALGVMSRFEDANGIMIDQGGRSTEFAVIKDGNISHLCSLNLGTFSINEAGDNAAKFIKKELEKLPEIYKEGSFNALYTVGGSPRQLFKAHQATAENCEKAELHGYTLYPEEMKQFVPQLKNTSPQDLCASFNVAKKRATLVPAAALFMETLLETVAVNQVIASRAGLRHGLAHEMVTRAAKERESKFDIRNLVEADSLA